MFQKYLYKSYIKGESRWLIALNCLAALTLAKIMRFIHDSSFSPLQNPSQSQNDLAVLFVGTLFVAFAVIGYEMSSTLVARLRQKTYFKIYALLWAIILLAAFISTQILTASIEKTNHSIYQNIPQADSSKKEQATDQYIHRDEPIRKFQGNLETSDIRDQFASFISDSDGKIVYIDAIIPNNITYGDESFSFTYKCEEKHGCPGEEYLIRVPSDSDAMYIHVDRLEAHRLKGYWSVMSGTAFNQGVSSNVLRGISTEMAQ